MKQFIKTFWPQLLCLLLWSIALTFLCRRCSDSPPSAEAEDPVRDTVTHKNSTFNALDAEKIITFVTVEREER